MTIPNPTQAVWFAMRATYRRELMARAALEAQGIRSFVPMRYELTRNALGRARRRLVPAIHNLIFVCATAEELRAAKEKIPYLQYMVRFEQGRSTGEKLIVPTDQMEAFMAAASAPEESLTWLSGGEINLRKGQRVRIHGVVCDGREGYLVKVPGFRSKRLVVAVEGLVAVALADVSADQLEPIK